MGFVKRKKKGLFYNFKKKSKYEKFYDKNEEFILYCIISLVCTSILYAVFFLVNWITKGNYVLANFFAYVISFTLLYRWDEELFKPKRESKKEKYRKMIIFILIRVVGFPIDSWLLFLLIDKYSMSSMIAKVLSSLIMFIYNYILNKLLVFNTK